MSEKTTIKSPSLVVPPKDYAKPSQTSANIKGPAPKNPSNTGAPRFKGGFPLKSPSPINKGTTINSDSGDKG